LQQVLLVAQQCGHVELQLQRRVLLYQPARHRRKIKIQSHPESKIQIKKQQNFRGLGCQSQFLIRSFWSIQYNSGQQKIAMILEDVLPIFECEFPAPPKWLKFFNPEKLQILGGFKTGRFGHFGTPKGNVSG